MTRIVNTLPIPVAPRDASYIDVANIFVFGPFDFSPMDARKRLVEFLRRPENGRLTRRIDRTRGFLRPACDPDEGVVDVIDAMGVAALMRRMDTPPLSDRMVQIIISGRYIGVVFAHVYGDGYGIPKMCGDLLGVATGQWSTARPEDPRIHFPLVRAVVKSGMYRRDILSEASAALRRYQRLEPVAPVDRPRPVKKLAVIEVDLRRFRAETPVSTGNVVKVSANSAVSLAVTNAFRSQQNRNGIELDVVMSIDCRRYIAPGRSVRGNFAPALFIGNLVRDQWDIELFAARSAQMVRSHAAVMSLIRGIRHDLRPFRRRGHPVEYVPGSTIAFSWVSSTAFAELPWCAGAERTVACISDTGSPLGVQVYMLRAADVMTVSLCDDSDGYDLDTVAADIVNRVPGAHRVLS